MSLKKMVGIGALLIGVTSCSAPLSNRERKLDNDYFARVAEMRTCWANSPCDTDLYDANGDGTIDTVITIGDFNLDGKQDYQIMRFDVRGKRIMWIKDESSDGNYEEFQVKPPRGSATVYVDPIVDQ